MDHYVYPEDFYKKDYINPLNQQATMGRSLILLYKLTGNDEYLNKASSLTELIKSSLQDNGKGGYILGDAIPGKISDKNKVVDISHATITIHFGYLAYKNNIAFDEEDMLKFTKTIKDLAKANDNHFPK